MTENEAQAMLQALSEHYRQPVMPLKKFCAALTTWMRCVERRNQDLEKKLPRRRRLDPNNPHPLLSGFGSSYFKLLQKIEIDIRKSNLLARLLYAGEELRTEMCPEHEGTWTGGPCRHGCGGTGWLPKEGPRRSAWERM